jgi:hypothetical protein
MTEVPGTDRDEAREHARETQLAPDDVEGAGGDETRPTGDEGVTGDDVKPTPGSTEFTPGQ